MTETLLLKHGGYRKLKSLQVARLVYDLTVRFCNSYVDRCSRAHDQMVRAARAGVQKIAEGSQASCTSKKNELKLTRVARASLEELQRDYGDFLRQRSVPFWEQSDVRRQSLIDRRCVTVDEVACWAREVHSSGLREPDGQIQDSEKGRSSPMSTSGYPEIAANGALVLLSFACTLLDRQIDSLAQAFENQDGFNEGLYRVRAHPRSIAATQRKIKDDLAEAGRLAIHNHNKGVF